MEIREEEVLAEGGKMSRGGVVKLGILGGLCPRIMPMRMGEIILKIPKLTKDHVNSAGKYLGPQITCFNAKSA